MDAPDVIYVSFDSYSGEHQIFETKEALAAALIGTGDESMIVVQYARVDVLKVTRTVGVQIEQA